MRTTATEISGRRAGERGAALVTSLLVAMLMLAAGGALLVTTGMTAANAVDSTAEAQAYYAAEAGLQAALTVIRRNRIPSGAPAPNFHNLVCGSASACTNGGNSLSAWLPYTDGRVALSAVPNYMAYEVKVSDAEKDKTDSITTDYTPRFLLVKSTGRGPKGATKVLEMMVDDFPFAFTARAAVAVRSNDDDNTGMTKLDLGSSDPHKWNGFDHATPAGASLPAFVVTNTADYDAGDGFGLKTDMPPNKQGVAEAAIGADQANVLGPQQIAKLSPSQLEDYLQTADNARAFLNTMKQTAIDRGRLKTDDSDIGTPTNPKFTFIDGDLDIKGGTDGAGLLIVTGTITQAGSSSFKGIVMALGDGKIVRNGTPGALGAMVVANFEHKTDAKTGYITGSGGFGSPYIDSSGGGNSLVGYDSAWVRKAMEALGSHVLGIVER